MSQYVETPCRCFAAAGALGQHLRVKTPLALALAGASDVELGTMEIPCLAAGPATVRLRTAQGTRKMIASDVITAGNPVYAAASGKVAPTGTVFCGVALEAATANNDVIEVLPGPNTDVTATITGTNAAAFEVDADAATPKIALSGQSGGAGDFTTTIKPESTLSADNAIICPESDGDVLMCLALAQALTAAKTMNTGVSFQFGTTGLAAIRFSAADASDPAMVIALDDTSQQLHITDLGAIATDWIRSAGTHPELSIHSNTTPATDYLAIGNHDGTSASIDVVGGTTLNLMIAGTTEMTITAAATSVPGMLSATESVANTAGVGITGTAAYFLTTVEKIGTIIKTTILIDLTGLNGGGTADDIIGADGAGVAHLGQITAAVNGEIVAGKVTCLETPAGSNVDVDLWHADENTGVEDTAISALTGEIKVINHGNWTGGEQGNLTAVIPTNKYMYLTSGAATAATFTAGIFLIELFGKAA
jgi:hypothetical protein